MADARGRRTLGKAECHALAAGDPDRLLRLFVADVDATDVLRILSATTRCLAELEAWAERGEGAAASWRLISTSLLVVYDAPHTEHAAVRAAEALAAGRECLRCDSTLGQSGMDNGEGACTGGSAQAGESKMRGGHEGCGVRVRCALIDFAHCFFGERGADRSFVDGAVALRRHMQQAWDDPEANTSREGGAA